MSLDRHHEAADGSELDRQLRREAARGRPAFSPALQARIMDAVASGGSRRRRRRAVPWPVAIAGCAILGIGGGLWLSGRITPTPSARSAPAVAAAAVEPASIDQLPLLDELGAELLAGTAMIAAEAVGLPRWSDLVDAGTAFAALGDDRPGSVTP